MTSPADTTSNRPARLPPRWVVRSAWAIHRAIFSLTGGRRGLRPATPKTWGMMRLRTIGRRSGKERHVILGYFEDGPNLVTMAMNGWDDGIPAWWRNLEARPEAIVRQSRRKPLNVRARAATGPNPAPGRCRSDLHFRRPHNQGQGLPHRH